MFNCVTNILLLESNKRKAFIDANVKINVSKFPTSGKAKIVAKATSTNTAKKQKTSTAVTTLTIQDNEIMKIYMMNAGE